MNQPSIAMNPFQFKSKIVPVITITQLDQALPLAEALLAGGIDVMEITLRHPAGLGAIAEVARHMPAMHVGAGTVLSADDVRRVAEAGASFALSPGCTPALVKAVQAACLPFIPGVMSASEVMAAREHGYQLMKLFPASVAGGVEMLKALNGPLADVKFCPTGGVSLTNLKSFLALSNVAMVGGSWLTPEDALNNKDWSRIKTLALQALEQVKSMN
jgi:2-dehydro-3-deoxyphosphogluconate aldolase / (4S)-4-hydroxy-2-oxoglutarate aldolase